MMRHVKQHDSASKHQKSSCLLLLVVLSDTMTITCPECCETRGRGKKGARNWSDVQWQKQSAVVECVTRDIHFNCCKQCSPTYNTDRLLATAGASSDARRQFGAQQETQRAAQSIAAAAYRDKQEKCFVPQSHDNPVFDFVYVNGKEIECLVVTGRPQQQRQQRHDEYHPVRPVAKHLWPPSGTKVVAAPTEDDIKHAESYLKSVPEAVMQHFYNSAMRLGARAHRDHFLRLASAWLGWDFNNTGIKFLSHFGAVRLRETSCRQCSWVHPLTREGYHDVGNYHYSRLIKICWPQLWNKLNENSRGDIIEAWLGLFFLLKETIYTRFKDPDAPGFLNTFEQSLDIFSYGLWIFDDRVYSQF
jgi:hypothetical protein